MGFIAKTMKPTGLPQEKPNRSGVLPTYMVYREGFEQVIYCFFTITPELFPITNDPVNGLPCESGAKQLAQERPIPGHTPAKHEGRCESSNLDKMPQPMQPALRLPANDSLFRFFLPPKTQPRQIVSQRSPKSQSQSISGQFSN